MVKFPAPIGIRAYLNVYIVNKITLPMQLPLLEPASANLAENTLSTNTVTVTLVNCKIRTSYLW